MRNLLFLVAAILIIAWLTGFFLFNAGNSIHLLPLLAVAAIIRAYVKAEEPLYIKKNHTWKIQDQENQA